ncbi:MAG: Gfo/Idh/MocA family oxidoreductase [Bryobacteraceae bacterium]|nr:Gfo/Idh/MocA family oxidoreductase [Bryobacteraceae bacterium]
MNFKRRHFLMTGAGSMLSWAAPPSDRIQLGVIGAGGRGRLVMGEFLKDSSVRAAAICDVYEPNLEQALSESGKAGSTPRAYRNYKQLLDSKEVNAVLIATPEHWHHRMVLDALAAGKDVYVEKPLCQTPEQGLELVAAEARSKQIVQVGMQRRSYDLFLEGRKIVAGGTLGPVRAVRSWWLNNNMAPRTPARLAGPLDWEQWQGPAQRRVAPDPERFRAWRSYSDYSGGVVADQGNHVFDGIHILMGAGFPLSVSAMANSPHAPHGDTPESVVVSACYPEDFLAIFTINYAAMRYKTRNDQATHLDGDKARMDVSREELKVYLEGAEETPSITRISAGGFHHATSVHVLNFLNCVRTRKTPAAAMQIGFQAALIPQLANLSLQSGRRVKWTGKSAIASE